MKTTLKIVFDNVPAEPGFMAAWGFACVVETDAGAILFDTGCDPDILLANMQKMDVDPRGLSSIVISHSHYDHAGGLAGVAREAGEVDIYLPPGSFPDVSTGHLRGFGASTLHGKSGDEIRPNAFLVHTTAHGWAEQSLVLKLDKSAVLVTGCSHPGIREITANAREIAGRLPLFVLGGFHLLGDNADEYIPLAQEMKTLGVTRIAPTHCTRDAAKEAFKREFGEGYVQIGVGAVIVEG
jgi:7,8-dihydropterin-6-yl-methyl-4-(beta-D-ribofuranosyl)aminobenzene 5'-phosphate synthase